MSPIHCGASVYGRKMIPVRCLQLAVTVMDRLASQTRAQRASPAKADLPAHLRIGKRGEEDAYFHLRRRGYTIIARNYRTSRHHGEIDLIGWVKDVLCFIEVKTRTTREVKPAEAAVDRRKRHDLRVVIRDYLRTLPHKRFPDPPPWRFDVVTVYYEQEAQLRVKDGALPTQSARKVRLRIRQAVIPTFELFQNASLSS